MTRVWRSRVGLHCGSDPSITGKETTGLSRRLHRCAFWLSHQDWALCSELVARKSGRHWYATCFSSRRRPPNSYYTPCATIASFASYGSAPLHRAPAPPPVHPAHSPNYHRSTPTRPRRTLMYSSPRRGPRATLPQARTTTPGSGRARPGRRGSERAREALRTRGRVEGCAVRRGPTVGVRMT